MLLFLIAIPVLGLLALGKFLFKNNESKTQGLNFVNKAQADVPQSNCGSNCDIGGGGGGSTCGSSCGACMCDDCCGGNGMSGDGTTCSTGSFGSFGRGVSGPSDTSDTGGGPSCSGCGGPGGSGEGGASASGGSDSCGDSCFEKGTLIAIRMKNGKEFAFKNIEDLKVGDEILGIDFNNKGKPTIKKSRVLQSFVHQNKDSNFLEMETKRGAKLMATENHPLIISSANSPLSMANLTAKNHVVSAFSEPKWDKVSKIKKIKTENATVFNIKTATSNYLVSQDGKGWVLVHNKI